MTRRVPNHLLRHPSVPQAHFTRGVEWHSWVARTRIGKATITRRVRPKGTPQWGKYVYDIRIEFTDGHLHTETVGGSARGARRTARETIYRHHRDAMMPKPRTYPEPRMPDPSTYKTPKPTPKPYRSPGRDIDDLIADRPKVR